MKQSSSKLAPEHKHLLLGARTETEASEQALENVISEAENDRAWAATEKLIKNGTKIEDVFGRVNGK